MQKQSCVLSELSSPISPSTSWKNHGILHFGPIPGILWRMRKLVNADGNWRELPAATTTVSPRRRWSASRSTNDKTLGIRDLVTIKKTRISRYKVMRYNQKTLRRNSKCNGTAKSMEEFISPFLRSSTTNHNTCFIYMTLLTGNLYTAFQRLLGMSE